MLLLLFISTELSCPALLPDLSKIAVIALIDSKPLAFNLENAISNPVQEETVMRNNQHAAGISLQKALQPLYHADIQMVGRLVQKQEIRLPDKGLSQTDTGPLPTGKGLHLSIKIIIRKTEAIGSPSDAAFKIIAFKMLKAFNNPGISLKLFLIMAAGNLRLHSLLLSSQGQNICKSRTKLLIKGSLSMHIRLLLHITDGIRLVDRYRALVVLHFSQKAFHQGGLACAISAHKAHALATLYLKADIIKKFFYAKGLGKAADLYCSHLSGTSNHLRIIFRVDHRRPLQAWLFIRLRRPL